MAAKKAAKKVASAPAAPARPAAAPSKKATLAHVLDADGARIRTYSVADHGDDFLAYAKEFASKEEGRSVESE